MIKLLTIKPIHMPHLPKRCVMYLRFVLALLLLMSTHGALAQNLTSEVDRQSLTIEETLRFTLRHNGQNSVPNPDFSDLTTDFEVLNQSRNNQFRSFNGQVEAWTEWNLILAPKREGQLTIPSVSLRQESTQPIAIDVTSATPVADGGLAKNLFIEAQFNLDQAYVQQQVLLTLRFHTALDIANIQPEPLELANAKWEEVSEKQYQRRINQKDYRVVEVIYAIYPQASGELAVPSLRWDITVGRRTSLFDFGSGTNTRRRLRTEPLSIPIQPKPDSFPKGEAWLPATNIQISDAWTDVAGRFTQGEPIARTLILQAEGLTASQLPSLAPTYPSEINAYPEPLKKEETKSRKGISTRLEQNQALVSTEAGQFTLSAVKIPWWNTSKDRLEYAELPAKTLLISAPKDEVSPKRSGTLPAQESPQSPTSQELASDAPNASSSIRDENASKGIPLWLYLTNGLTLILAMFFGAMWLFQKRKGQKRSAVLKPSLSSSSAEAQWVIEACQKRDAQQTYEKLRQWTLHVVEPSGERVRNVVGQLSKMLPGTQDALTRLDKHLFGAVPNITASAPTNEDFDTIAKAVKAFKPSQKLTEDEVFAPLNPV